MPNSSWNFGMLAAGSEHPQKQKWGLGGRLGYRTGPHPCPAQELEAAGSGSGPVPGGPERPGPGGRRASTPGRGPPPLPALRSSQCLAAWCPEPSPCSGPRGEEPSLAVEATTCHHKHFRKKHVQPKLQRPNLRRPPPSETPRSPESFQRRRPRRRGGRKRKAKIKLHGISWKPPHSPATAAINIIISNAIFYVTLLLVNQLLGSSETLTPGNSVKV